MMHQTVLFISKSTWESLTNDVEPDSVTALLVDLVAGKTPVPSSVIAVDLSDIESVVVIDLSHGGELTFPTLLFPYVINRPSSVLQATAHGH